MKYDRMLIVLEILKGHRIALRKEFCEKVGVNVGEKPVISKNDEEDNILQLQKVMA